MPTQYPKKPASQPGNPAVVRVGIYCRISTDESRQPYSLGAQHAACQASCKARGWVEVAHYVDEASGATLERPQLHQALEDAAAGKLDVLLFYRLDRFSRKLYDLLALIVELEEANVAIASVTEQLDTSSPIGRVVVHILGAFAELEREMIRDRISQGVARRAQSGKWTGSLPVGMTWDENRNPVADPAWLPLAERIFEMYVLDHLGSTAIARQLNDEGLRTPTGAKWSPTKIILILRSAAYVGIVRYNGEYHTALHAPVLDREMWDKAQELREQRAQNPATRRSNTSDYLVSGLTRCPRCKRAYVGGSANGHGGRYRYYRCQGRDKYGASHCDNESVRADLLETLVTNQLVDVLANTPLIKAAWDRAERAASKSTPNRRRELGQIENELAKLKQSFDKYAQAFEADVLDGALLQDHLETLTLRRQALIERREQITSRTRDPQPFPADTINDLRRMLANTAGDPSMNARTKALLRILIKEIEIDGKTVRCTYRLPRESEVRAPTGEVGFELEVPDDLTARRAEITDVVSKFVFASRVSNAKQRQTVHFRKQVTLDPAFRELWGRISKRTRYRVSLSSGTLVEHAAAAIGAADPIDPPKIRVRVVELEHTMAGIGTEKRVDQRDYATAAPTMLPDILAELQNETDLTRATLVDVLRRSGRLGDFLVNPQAFTVLAASRINSVMHRQIVDGIKYEPIPGLRWEMRRLEPDASEELERYAGRLYKVQSANKTLYDHVEIDSEVERRFARSLDDNKQVQFFMKLPAWFTVDTPIGPYNPDWAIVFEGSERVYLVRETKGSADPDELRGREETKIRCAREHFDAIGVDYSVTSGIDEMISRLSTG